MELHKNRFRLREVRLERGLTQSEVADAAKLSRRFYVALESERQEPRVVAGMKVARVLKTTVEDLFGHLVKEAAPTGKPK